MTKRFHSPEHYDIGHIFFSHQNANARSPEELEQDLKRLQELRAKVNIVIIALCTPVNREGRFLSIW